MSDSATPATPPPEAPLTPATTAIKTVTAADGADARGATEVAPATEVDVARMRQRRQELTVAVEQLLRPSHDVVAKVKQAATVQTALADEIDAVAKHLHDVAERSYSLGSPLPQIEQYLARMRQCRQRIATLHASLSKSKIRLIKVHGPLTAQTEVAERRNATTQATLRNSLGAAAPSSADATLLPQSAAGPTNGSLAAKPRPADSAAVTPSSSSNTVAPPPADVIDAPPRGASAAPAADSTCATEEAEEEAEPSKGDGNATARTAATDDGKDES